MSILMEIYDGWKNFIFDNPEAEEEAKRRMTICVSNKCGKFTKNKFCAVCGCYMPAKVRSVKSKCFLGKWK
jgi:hypothetical protein